jgi:hypothetical protein
MLSAQSRFCTALQKSSAVNWLPWLVLVVGDNYLVRPGLPPVASSSQCAPHLRHGEFLLVADEPEEIIDRVVAILKSPDSTVNFARRWSNKSSERNFLLANSTML